MAVQWQRLYTLQRVCLLGQRMSGNKGGLDPSQGAMEEQICLSKARGLIFLEGGNVEGNTTRQDSNSG